MRLNPRSETQLGVAIASGSVNVIDPVRAYELHRLICLVLADIAECGSAKENAGAFVASTAELLMRDHGPHSAPLAMARAFQPAALESGAQSSPDTSRTSD